MAIDIIARGMIEDSNSDISQLSEKVNNHTDDSDIHVTVSDKESWNSHPNDVQAEGNPVVMDNLQGGVPFSEMTVKGKNLIVPKSVSRSVNGINFAVNSDKSITINGTSTSGTSFMIGSAVLNKNEKYTLSILSESKGINIHIGSGDDFSNPYDYTATAKTITAMSEDNTIWIWISANKSFDNVIIYPQLELGDTATAYEPPITGRELTVNVSGKNLLPYPYADTTKTVNGITFTDNGDGTITANGTATANTTFKLSNNYMYKSGINYVVSGCPNGDGSAYKLKGNAEDVNADDVGNGKSFLFEKDTDCSICILIYRNATVDNLVFRPQLELGDTATPYEPYNGSVTTITPTSNPYIIPNDIRQQDGLNNISVSAGKLSVTGVRKNAALKKIWDEIDEIKTAIIVSNGESE